MSTDLPTEPTATSASPEQRFLEFVRTGDKAIIQGLITEFADRSYNQARRIIGRSNGAEDAVQDAYLRLVHGAKKYDGSVPFGAWLGRLVNLAALNYRERSLSRQINLSDMSDQGVAAMNQQISAVESADSPEVEALRTALDTLPAHYRTPLTMYYFGGLNQKELAQTLGAPMSTIANQLARGLEQLRMKLGRAGFAVTSAGLLTVFASIPTYAAPPAFKASLVASERLIAAGRHISQRLLKANGASWQVGPLILKTGIIGVLIAGAVTVMSVNRHETPVSPAVQATPGLVAHWTFDEGQGSSAVSAVGNALAGDLVNRPLWTTGKIGGALTFNGHDNYVSVLNSSNLNSIQEQMTVSAWVFKRAHLPDGKSDWGSIVQRRLGIKHEDFLNLLYDIGTEDRYRFIVTTASGEYTVTGPSSMGDLNLWVHLAGVYDGAQLHIYRNGVLVASAPCTGSFALEATPVIIGATDGGIYGIDEHINATIDDVRIYNQALSESEIAVLWNRTEASAALEP